MIRVLSNCHTHTNYCDGISTPREMAEKAVEKGFVSLGFSVHSPLPYDNDYAIKETRLPIYLDEIATLKKEYEGKLEILSGIELDADSDVDLSPFDYVISSVHQLHSEDGEKTYAIDNTPEEFAHCIDELFDGDVLAMAEKFYAVSERAALRDGVHIVGHFDLISKFNEKNAFFDNRDPHYLAFARNAIYNILRQRPGMMFEVNTGCMYRNGKMSPYPCALMLSVIFNNGGRVILSSDAHNTHSLDYAFDDALIECKKAGFTCVWRLRKGGIEKVEF